jgi:hypothetical protein
VAGIVAAVSERKVEDGVERPWEDRKQEVLPRLQRADPEAVAVKAADALHSARSLTRDLGRVGPSIWAVFSRGPRPSLWYYQSIGRLVSERLGEHPLARELDRAVRDLEQKIAETGGC